MKCYFGVREDAVVILSRVKDEDGRRVEDFYYIVKAGESFCGISYDRLRAHGDGEMEVDGMFLRNEVVVSGV